VVGGASAAALADVLAAASHRSSERAREHPIASAPVEQRQGGRCPGEALVVLAVPAASAVLFSTTAACPVVDSGGRWVQSHRDR
jgi:hypothetical protein